MKIGSGYGYFGGVGNLYGANGNQKNSKSSLETLLGGGVNANSAVGKLYDNISKLSQKKLDIKTSPFGGRTTGETIKKAGRGILDAAGAFKDKSGKSVFSTLRANTSDDKVAAATADNLKIGAKPPDQIKLNVKQTATAQINDGTALASKDKSAATGWSSFSIETNGKKNVFTINVEAGDNNEKIQQKMADAINSRKIGVTASVNKYEKEGKSELSLTSVRTGENGKFSVSDMYGGTLAAATGITNVRQEAQNAVYSINGGAEKTSESNDISIEKGVDATLKGAGSAVISFDSDTDSAVKAVKDLVGAVNTALKAANPTDGGGSSRFALDVAGMNKSYSSALSKVGVNVSRSGELSVNESKLKDAAKDGSLGKVFDNNSFGFTNRASHIANYAANTNYYGDSSRNYSFSNGAFNLMVQGGLGMLFDMSI